jgi:hypothetical protein
MLYRYYFYSRITVLVILLNVLLAVQLSTDAAGTTIPANVKDSVSFVFVRDSKGKEAPLGTAFFVVVKHAKDPAIGHFYLVTAKHVLQDDKKQYWPLIFIRLNKRAGGAESIAIPLQGKSAAPIFVHSDPGVDLAVIPMAPDQDVYDYKVVPEDMFASIEKVKELKITEGDEVFFTGLFASFYGERKNYPIVRFGRVALITDETVPWPEDTNKEPLALHLYLIEAQSFGGNSGSPVFFYLTGMRDPAQIRLGGYDLVLAGVMKGYFSNGSEVKIFETRKTPYSFQNVGIAAVVPAYQIREILYSPEVRAYRVQMEDLVKAP